MSFLKIGVIKSTFGLNGEVKILSTSNNLDIRFKLGNKIFVENDKNILTIENVKISNKTLIVKFKEINDIDLAKQYLNKTLMVTKDYNDLNEGYFFYDDLIGCKVFDIDHKIDGIVIDIIEFPAQLNLKIKVKNKNCYIPFIKEFIKNVDIDKKEILINYMEGLL